MSRIYPKTIRKTDINIKEIFPLFRNNKIKVQFLQVLYVQLEEQL